MPGPYRIAIAGAGVAGLTSAALLARAGHEVTVYDRFPEPRPVGSGLMIQPVGLAVLDRLGLADRLTASASPIRQILGHANGRRVLDVRYDALRPGLVGHAVQRGVLFSLLLDAAREAGAIIEPNSTVTETGYDRDGPFLYVNGIAIGPQHLILDCLGSFSPLCPAPSKPLTYGALFALLDWPEGTDLAANRLEQRYERAHRMAGVLPVGQTPGGKSKCTYFWSLRHADLETWRAAPLDDWKADARRLWPATEPLLDQILSHDDLVFARYTHHTVARPARGQIVHLGDSHHATSPQLGQGANTALLDAAAFADAVAVTADPVAAGRVFARARRAHVRFYQTASWAFTPLYQSRSRVLPWLRDRIGAPIQHVPPMPRILAKLVAGEIIRPIR